MSINNTVGLAGIAAADSGPAPHPPAADDALYRRVTKRIVPVLVIAYFFGHLERVNIGFAKLQMLGTLGMSEVAYGIGAGILFGGYLSSRSRAAC